MRGGGERRRRTEEEQLEGARVTSTAHVQQHPSPPQSPVPTPASKRRASGSLTSAPLASIARRLGAAGGRLFSWGEASRGGALRGALRRRAAELRCRSHGELPKQMPRLRRLSGHALNLRMWSRDGSVLRQGGGGGHGTPRRCVLRLRPGDA